MKRLYDIILERGNVSPQGIEDALITKNALRDSLVISADGTAEYLISAAGRRLAQWNIDREIPSLIPPAPRSFVEVSNEATTLVPEASGTGILSWGILCDSTDLIAEYATNGSQNPEQDAHIRASQIFHSLQTKEDLPAIDNLLPRGQSDPGNTTGPQNPGARWLVSTELFTENHGHKKILSGACGMYFVVAQDGSISKTVAGNGAAKMWQFSGNPQENLKLPKTLPIGASLTSVVRALYLPLLLTLAFTSHPLTTLGEETPDQLRNKRHLKKHKEPLVTYAEPDLRLLKESLSSETLLEQALQVHKHEFRVPTSKQPTVSNTSGPRHLEGVRVANERAGVPG